MTIVWFVQSLNLCLWHKKGGIWLILVAHNFFYAAHSDSPYIQGLAALHPHWADCFHLRALPKLSPLPFYYRSNFPTYSRKQKGKEGNIQSRDLRNGWEGGQGGQRSLGCAREVRKICAQDMCGYSQGTWVGFSLCLQWVFKQTCSHLTASCCWHTTQHCRAGLYHQGPDSISPHSPVHP